MSFGLFQREQRSLFGEILDWMLTPLLLLWPLSLALTWFVAQGIASKPFDRALEFNLQALTQFVQAHEGHVSFNLNAQARDLLRADDSDLVYYQVLDSRGTVISGDADFPRPGDDMEPTPGLVQMRDDMVRGDEVRVAYIWLERNDPERLVLMQVAETRGKRSTLAAEIIKGVMVPQFVILPLAVLLVWLALVRGIRPRKLTVIAGRPGSGKTTLARLLAGYPHADRPGAGLSVAVATDGDATRPGKVDLENRTRRSSHPRRKRCRDRGSEQESFERELHGMTLIRDLRGGLAANRAQNMSLGSKLTITSAQVSTSRWKKARNCAVVIVDAIAPRCLRNSSTFGASMPVSMTTASPGPVETTVASPWPTSRTNCAPCRRWYLPARRGA